jgi:hypothetical protein
MDKIHAASTLLNDIQQSAAQDLSEFQRMAEWQAILSARRSGMLQPKQDNSALEANKALQADLETKDAQILDLTKRLERMKVQSTKTRTTLEERLRVADAEFASTSWLSSRLMALYHGKIAPDKLEALKDMLDEFDYELDPTGGT